MTTATSNFSWSNASGTTAKAWLNAVNDLVIAAGLVATSDTGQLDLTATPSSFGASASFGYRVYKFPDTLQSTTPIFVKLTLANDSSGRPIVTAQVSGATDGAGALSTPRFDVNSTSMGTFQASLNSYACYVDGTFTMVLGHTYKASDVVNNAVCALVIDRARDATGTALAGGFLCESNTTPQASATQSRSMFGSASPALDANFVPGLVPSKAAISSSAGANVNVFRHYMMVPGVAPSLGSLTYFNAEFGALTPFTATVLGSSHTWLPVGVAMNYWSANQIAAHCAAIRWE